MRLTFGTSTTAPTANILGSTATNNNHWGCTGNTTDVPTDIALVREPFVQGLSINYDSTTIYVLDPGFVSDPFVAESYVAYAEAGFVPGSFVDGRIQGCGGSVLPEGTGIAPPVGTYPAGVGIFASPFQFQAQCGSAVTALNFSQPTTLCNTPGGACPPQHPTTCTPAAFTPSPPGTWTCALSGSNVSSAANGCLMALTIDLGLLRQASSPPLCLGGEFWMNPAFFGTPFVLLSGATAAGGTAVADIDLAYLWRVLQCSALALSPAPPDSFPPYFYVQWVYTDTAGGFGISDLAMLRVFGP